MDGFVVQREKHIRLKVEGDKNDFFLWETIFVGWPMQATRAPRICLHLESRIPASVKG